MPMIETLIFDLDETLLYEEKSVDTTFSATCRLVRDRYGIEKEAVYPAARETAEALWRAGPVHAYCESVGISSWEGLAGVFSGDDPSLKILREWVPEFRQSTWTQALARVGIVDEELVACVSQFFIEERRRHHVPFPETERVLNVLSEQYRLAMITNGAPDVQLEKLNIPGLGRYFDPVIVSGEIGIGKPAREIFEHAVRRMRLSPATALMIGDNPVNDVQGAQKCGIKAVWVNRTGQACPDGIEPDAEISHLNELLQILD